VFTLRQKAPLLLRLGGCLGVDLLGLQLQVSCSARGSTSVFYYWVKCAYPNAHTPSPVGFGRFARYGSKGGVAVFS
jgi:hypothetical protein